MLAKGRLTTYLFSSRHSIGGHVVDTVHSLQNILYFCMVTQVTLKIGKTQIVNITLDTVNTLQNILYFCMVTQVTLKIGKTEIVNITTRHSPLPPKHPLLLHGYAGHPENRENRKSKSHK